MYSAMLRFMFLFPIFCVFALTAVAAEEGGGENGEHGEPGEKKVKQEEKPKPDSVISAVMILPEVKAWEKWIQSQNNGHTLNAWGESVRSIEGNECWGVAVVDADASGDNTRILKRFCVTMGGTVWVETKSKDPLEGAPLIPYDTWKKQCDPTPQSPGTC